MNVCAVCGEGIQSSLHYCSGAVSLSNIPSSAVPKSLSDNDLANLAKIAALRGYSGKLRAAIQTVHATLFVAREEVGITPLEESIYVTLSRALETPVPEDAT